MQILNLEGIFSIFALYHSQKIDNFFFLMAQPLHQILIYLWDWGVCKTRSMYFYIVMKIFYPWEILLLQRSGLEKNAYLYNVEKLLYKN